MHRLADLRSDRAPARGWRGLWLLLAVLLVHGWLIDRLGRRAPMPVAQHDGALRPRPLQTLPSLQTLQTLRPVPPPAAAAPARAVPQPPMAPRPSSRPLAAPRPLEALPTPAAVAAPASPPEALAGAQATAAETAAELAAEPAAAASGEPPPVYATRVPAPALLRYALSYHGLAGEATLSWQTDGRQYLLALDGRRDGQRLVEQASRGGFDAAGLAPERFVDRRRGRQRQAANFQRESGRIGFSGPAVQYPAWPGAQDRLGWIAQLAAIAGAAAEPLRSVSVFVVDARGSGELWTFHSQGTVAIETPLGAVQALHLRRDAARADALQVEVWLDPARGHWPAALRFTAPWRRDAFELRLAAEPGLPP